MKRFVLILTAMTFALTLCACTFVEPNPEDPVEDAVGDAMGGAIEYVIDDVEDIEVEDPVADDVELVEDVFDEEENVYGGICPFTVNLVDPDNVSENAIYIETGEIPEGATEHIIDQLAHTSSGVLVDIGFSEKEANGASVASAFRAYNGSAGEYYDIFYFPIMYGDEVIAMSISSYNSETDKYSFQMGKDQISDVMNYLETSPENPALFVYFDDISGGFFITTTSAYRLVADAHAPTADEDGLYEIAEEDIPDYIREIMNREVNPDNVVAIYGATVTAEELIDD